MKSTVYVDNTVISYLSSSAGRDLVTNARKIITQEWWSMAAQYFELLVSDFIEQEAAAGNPEAAKLRLAVIADLAFLPTTDPAIERLAQALIQAGALPNVARYDALHVATAAVHGIEYLVTWNFAHLANPRNLSKVEQACRQAGYEPPRIVTPDQLTVNKEGIGNVD